MSQEHDQLIVELGEFVKAIRSRSDQLLALADRDVAQAMAAWPQAALVRKAAESAARATGYLDRSPTDEMIKRFAGVGRTPPRPHWGRAFDADALYRLGVAGLARARDGFEPDVLVRQLAEYLAGPPASHWRYIILSIDWEPPEFFMVGKWRLSRPTADEFRALRPVPIAADFTSEISWDPLLYSGEYVVLSAKDLDATPLDGPGFRFFSLPSSMHAWRPLLLFNLWEDTPVYAVAEYLVESARRVERLHGALPSQLAGEHGEHEIPLLGPPHIDGAESQRVVQYLQRASALLDAWDERAGAKKKSVDRLQRSAVRFLDPGRPIDLEGDALYPSHRSSVLTNFVASLENLLSADDEDSVDLRRRAAQRAAVLVGRDDAEREGVNRIVSEAYKARNRIAHGADPSPEVLANATSATRSILRKALIGALLIGPNQSMASVCDRALLSNATLNDEIRGPIDAFHHDWMPSSN